MLQIFKEENQPPQRALRSWKSQYPPGFRLVDPEHCPGYLTDNTSVPADYIDPKNSVNNDTALSAITIQWDAAASNEVNLERIITQKWLAIFPDGQEAWAEFRRTGYPRLFPVVDNTSAGAIDNRKVPAFFILKAPLIH